MHLKNDDTLKHEKHSILININPEYALENLFRRIDPRQADGLPHKTMFLCIHHPGSTILRKRLRRTSICAAGCAQVVV